MFCVFFFFKQKTAYEMRISDWSSDVCSSDLSGSAHEILSCPLSEVCQGTRIACSRSAARRWIVRRKSHKETLRPPAAAAPDDGKRRGKLSPEDPRVTVTLHQIGRAHV